MNVLIVGGGYAYKTMYENFGGKEVGSIAAADVIQFTGGSDVSPRLYGEHSHPTTYSSNDRDMYEEAIYREAVKQGKFCVGICRGGQFLNVMNGGSMYQDVNGHAIHGTHGVLDVLTGSVIQCTSTHHQMMRMGEGGVLVAKSDEMLSQRKSHMSLLSEERKILITYDEVEVESVYYPETRSLCFQPHPEIVRAGHPCQDYFFSLLGRYYNAEI